MDVTQYLVAELDDSVNRLTRQILELVPLERQLEQLDGSNSVTWTTYHAARHAALALAVVAGTPSPVDPRLDAFDLTAILGGAGLQETQQPFTATLMPADVNAYAAGVFSDVRRYLETVDEATLDALPDAERALDAAGVDHVSFDWLYRMWADQTVAFLVRWPMIGHLTHHVGELTAVRNRMGLSPFR